MCYELKTVLNYDKSCDKGVSLQCQQHAWDVFLHFMLFYAGFLL